MKDKPRIRVKYGLWMCYLKGEMPAYSDKSPAEAYARWAARDLLRRLAAPGKAKELEQ